METNPREEALVQADPEVVPAISAAAAGMKSVGAQAREGTLLVRAGR